MRLMRLGSILGFISIKQRGRGDGINQAPPPDFGAAEKGGLAADAESARVY